MFGDLNYRIDATTPKTKECQECLSEKNQKNCNVDGEMKCRWRYDRATGVSNGTCGHKLKLGPIKDTEDELKNTKAKYCVDYSYYFDLMTKDVNPSEPNGMYKKLKSFDSLLTSFESTWESRGFRMVDFTANTPPTYKRKYGEDKDAYNCYQWQALVDKPANSDTARSDTTPEVLLEWLKRCYQVKEKAKSCDTKYGLCIDFGWLDRLLIRSGYSTATTPGAMGNVLAFRSLKTLEHKESGMGDHSPLFMFLES
jgi:hypothetical protein